MESLLLEYVKKWSLSEAKLLHETPTSFVYSVLYQDKEAILKILTTEGKEHEGNSWRALKLFPKNISVEMYQWDDGALLLEYLPGPDLVNVVRNSGDEKAARILCQLLSNLHTVSECPEQFFSLERQFKSLLERAELQDQDPLFYQAADVAKELIETQKNPVLLHGDIHHQNILKGKSGFKIIDPQPFYGESTYDYANTFFNPDVLPDIVEKESRILKLADIYSSHLNVTKERVLMFALAHGGLSSSWCLDDQSASPERRLRISRIILECLT